MYDNELRCVAAGILNTNKNFIKYTWNELTKTNIMFNRSVYKFSLTNIDKILRSLIRGLLYDNIEIVKDVSYSIAAELAYKDISYKDFITSMNSFEESYTGVFLKEGASIDNLRYLMIINNLFNKFTSFILEEYFNVKDTTVVALVKLAELRDDTTGNHLERTREYTVLLSKELGQNEDFIKDIERASLLHDIGKVGIKDSILLKSGKLTTEEFEEMKQHTIIGARTISEIIKSTNSPRSHLKMSKDIALHHHEKYDGSGYPFNLKGENIPFEARIFALADAYDVIVSKRPYKEPLSHEEAVRRIISDSGRHFDPNVVKAFEKIQSAFNLINNRHKEVDEFEVLI